MRYNTEKAFKLILDTMTGADGGGNFVRYKALLEDLDNRAVNGDDIAEQIITTIVIPFSRLIMLAIGETGK
jgi:hypothetical protein